MRIRLWEYFCIAALFAALVLWHSITDYKLALRVVVCFGAVVAALQAFQSAGYRWTVCFLLIALLFNPVILFLPLAKGLGLSAMVLTAATCVLSLTGIEAQPLFSIASIADLNPGSELL